MISWTSLKMGQSNEKLRQQAKFRKLFVLHRSHNFSPVPLNDSQNFCLDDISGEFLKENG